jgi:3'-5' exoribonuclease
MWRELRSLVANIGDVKLRALVDAILDDSEIAQRFRRAPAAKQIHHAWLGGLLEHVLSLCHLCRFTAQHYRVDLDLLLAGAVLHDIGKIYELSYDRSFGYSAEGQLLGHMVIGLRIVSDKLRSIPDFPPQLRTLLEHMIVSHHGKLEFGSPKLPQFPEALLLHYLDDMDSKMECMRSLVEQDRQVTGYFTSYNVSLERTVLKKAKYMSTAVANGGPPVARAPIAAAFDADAAEFEAPEVPKVTPPAVPKVVPNDAGHPLFVAPPAQGS